MKNSIILCISIVLVNSSYAGREFKRSATTTSVENIKKLAKQKYDESNNAKTLPLSFLSISDLSGLQEIIPNNCTHLDLSKNHLTNTGLKSFKEISSLTIKSIDLSANDFNQLTEEEIKQLRDSFPSLDCLHLSKKNMKQWDNINEAAKRVKIKLINSSEELGQEGPQEIPYIYHPSQYSDEEPFSSDGQQSPESQRSITLSAQDSYTSEEATPLLNDSDETTDSDYE